MSGYRAYEGYELEEEEWCYVQRANIFSKHLGIFITHVYASKVIKRVPRTLSSSHRCRKLHCLVFVSADALAVNFSAFGASSFGIYSSTNYHKSASTTSPQIYWNTNLQVRRRREILVVEQILSLLLRLHLIRLRFLRIGAKNTDEIFVFPLLDVVVGGVHAVDVAFDGVAFVADDKAICYQFIPHFTMVSQRRT